MALGARNIVAPNTRAVFDPWTSRANTLSSETFGPLSAWALESWEKGKEYHADAMTSMREGRNVQRQADRQTDRRPDKAQATEQACRALLCDALTASRSAAAAHPGQGPSQRPRMAPA
ncbi:hypothetical protein ACCO45_006861 [Purpureocillium lilacinum]|uniref:Uncharacterized protein n=1 Tax=Purpureocillium lilacinum TaxID=33203 RepID=A0ACC4DQV0_PURLI